ncbi:MAG: hypothetical protein ACQKBU_02960 [Verrucomicrobiales bacterium]
MFDYDTRWLGDALRRAAQAAEREDFPFLDEIRQGIEEYLESKCSLELLPLDSLYSRVRKMLETIGCHPIAEKLEPLAPPVTVSLEEAAREAGNGFELAFFSHLRDEISELRNAGAEEVRFVGLRESVQLLSGAKEWNEHCDRLLTEIRSFLQRQDRGHQGLDLDQQRSD